MSNYNNIITEIWCVTEKRVNLPAVLLSRRKVATTWVVTAVDLSSERPPKLVSILHHRRLGSSLSSPPDRRFRSDLAISWINNNNKCLLSNSNNNNFSETTKVLPPHPRRIKRNHLQVTRILRPHAKLQIEPQFSIKQHRLWATTSSRNPPASTILLTARTCQTSRSRKGAPLCSPRTCSRRLLSVERQHQHLIWAKITRQWLR